MVTSPRVGSTILNLSLFLQITWALIAYDCGHEKMNKTRISLLGTGDCDIKVPNITHEIEDIQLLELNEVASIHIYQCKINILQSVYYCGMFSHLSVVPGGLSSFIADISKDECIKIHHNGTLQLQNNKMITDIHTNASTHHTETIAGVIESNGACKGTSFSYGARTWDGVIVIQTFEITITDYYAVVRLEDNQVILRNNLLCPYLHQQCMDLELGMSFWNLIPDASCETLNYHVLYQGNATRAQNKNVNNDRLRTIYTVSAGDVVFALEVVKSIAVCRYNGFQTEHPRLVIVRKSTYGYWFTKKAYNSKNLDLLTYVNAKFVYVERHIKSQIQTLYLNLVHKKCELERDVIQMQLAVAHHHPSEFAMMRMKEHGYTAIPRGEVIYIIKCQAVEVTIRETPRCFNELPVNYNNNSFFLAPTTHLLQEYGTEIPCSSTLMPAYLLHGAWFGFNPQSHRLDSPGSLKPSEDIPWIYEESENLIKAGVYSAETSEALRKQIMYPTERKAIENVITRALTGHDTDQQRINVLHLFSQDHFDQMKGFLQGTWWLLKDFGVLYSIGMCLWILIRIIKYLFGLILNFIMIRGAYGRSWWLLAALCTTCTTYVLHKGKRRREEAIYVINADSSADIEAANNPTQVGDLEEVTSSRVNPITLESLQRQTKLYPSLRV